MTKNTLGRIISLGVFVAVIVTVCVSCLIMCDACSKNEEWGFFTVSFYKDRTVAYITGLTELGEQQKIIAIPKEIDGASVAVIGEKTIAGGPQKKEWHSDKLEKIFVSKRISIVSATFRDCPNLKKAISVYGGAISHTDCLVYFANNIYLSINPTQINSWGRANISYKFNYKNDENYGYYWVDDCDYGSRIEYVPDDPTREGYMFTGWYKEEECINKWDFATDTLPETQYGENKEVIYQETTLYAGWSKSN